MSNYLNFSLEGKVALVTGSSRGIGRGIVLEFAKNGYDVVINYNTSKDSAFSLFYNTLSLFSISDCLIT